MYRLHYVQLRMLLQNYKLLIVQAALVKDRYQIWLIISVSRCLVVNISANGLHQDSVNNTTHHTRMVCYVVYMVLTKAIGQNIDKQTSANENR